MSADVGGSGSNWGIRGAFKPSNTPMKGACTRVAAQSRAHVRHARADSVPCWPSLRPLHIATPGPRTSRRGQASGWLTRGPCRRRAPSWSGPGTRPRQGSSSPPPIGHAGSLCFARLPRCSARRAGVYTRGRQCRRLPVALWLAVAVLPLTNQGPRNTLPACAAPPPPPPLQTRCRRHRGERVSAAGPGGQQLPGTGSHVLQRPACQTPEWLPICQCK